MNIRENATKIVNRTCYALTGTLVIVLAGVILTGKPKIEYRVSFGNADAAEVIEARVDQKNADDMAHNNSIENALGQKAKQQESEDAKTAVSSKPGHKPTPPTHL